MALHDTLQFFQLRGTGGQPLALGLAFTTDGSNDPTLLDTHGGTISIARSTNTYTITLPSWEVTQCVIAEANNKALNIVKTITPDAGSGVGTIVLAFSAALTSGRCDVFALLNGDV